MLYTPLPSSAVQQDGSLIKKGVTENTFSAMHMGILSLRQLLFLARMLIFKLRHGKRLKFEGWSVYMERASRILISKDSAVHLGRNTYIRKEVDIEAYDGASVLIGSNSFINKNTTIIARFGISIGKDCIIAENVSIYDHNHGHALGQVTFKAQPFVGTPIRIGDNVWVGAMSFIGRGVTIGNNVVIAAHSTITKDVPGNTLVKYMSRQVVRELA